MSSSETEKVEHDTQEMANMLAWGPVEDGALAAGAVREVQEHEDRLRRDSRRDRIPSPFTAGQKLYGILSVGLVVLSVLFFFWLAWIFVQKLTFGPP